MVRAIDHDIATGVWPDMREHGWETDDWPAIFEKVKAADILVLAGPIWLGDNSSVMKQVHERLYGGSHLLNDRGQYLYYGRVGGCLITGNEDGIKHCAQNVLYTLQHIGYTIPPQADAGWIGEAGPGPSYLDPGSGGPENDFTNRNTTFMTWNLMHLARHAQGRRRRSGARQPAVGVGRRLPLRLREPRVPMTGAYAPRVAHARAPTTRLVAGVSRAGDEAVFAELLTDWSRSMLLPGPHLRLDRSLRRGGRPGHLAGRHPGHRPASRAGRRCVPGCTGSSSTRPRSAACARAERCRGAACRAVDEDRGPTVDPALFRDADDQYPGGWRTFPARVARRRREPCSPVRSAVEIRAGDRHAARAAAGRDHACAT